MLVERDWLTLEAVNGDEGRGFGRNDPGVEVGKLVRLQVAAEDLKASCVKVAPDSPQHFRSKLTSISKRSDPSCLTLCEATSTSRRTPGQSEAACI